MDFQTENILHMPDLLFAKLCHEKYEINKGVLNEIDLWFYKRGIGQITERRQSIISFFQYLRLTDFKGKKVKFGPGGLTMRLEQFWQQKSGRIEKVVHYAGK